MEPGNPRDKQIMAPANDSKSRVFWRKVIEWVQVIVIALAISLPIRFFIAEPFIVDGASMDPTFDSRQFLIVDRLSYRFNAPSRQDVIVFRYPKNPSTYFIKRIIGLPGETVEIKDGQVSISSPLASTTTIILNEPYISSDHRSYENLKVTLDSNEYFVMGDNRANSSDSRVWGSLDKDLVIGRPVIRFLPPAILPGKI
ncbi:MAG: signal peptidase I [Candidatus Paceibacterota bacterium]|jgi:signal peptidase I